MGKVFKVKNKATLLLVFAILLLCLGFILTACGVGPATKADNPDKGQYALDITDCPIANTCLVAFTSTNFSNPKDSIQGSPLTLEAWIKPTTTTAGNVLSRSSNARGALLRVTATSTPSSVVPRFEIRRVQSDGTSTVSYTVDGTAVTINSEWTHIAGVLTNQDHSTVHPGVTCAGVDGDATDDQWHLDFYQNGALVACAETHDGLVADDTPEADAYAHEPAAKTVGLGFYGIIDEARIWKEERTISECMNTQLGLSGTCSRTSDNLIFYSKFNEGEGHSVYDFAGVFGSGGKEYPDPNNAGEFLEWNTGWTTDTPF